MLQISNNAIQVWLYVCLVADHCQECQRLQFSRNAQSKFAKKGGKWILAGRSSEEERGLGWSKSLVVKEDVCLVYML